MNEKNETQKNTIVETETEKVVGKLEKLISTDDKPIYKVSSVFPFNLIPNTIEIFTDKIVITRRIFPFITREFPILIENINNAHVSQGMFLATMTIEITGFETNPEPISNLPKKDALTAERIIMGMVLVNKRKIDVSMLKKEVLIKELKKMV